MEELVSVIVPVYNVKEYLDECVESIVTQSYTNLEIVLIDDGSTDLSGEKCDEWAEKDERITVIHQENMGLSAARNSGIDKCLGGWITFIDSDDVVREDYIAYLYELTQRYNVLVAQCANIDLQEKAKKVDNDIDNKMKSNEFLLSSQYRTMAWGKIYKKELFEKERYPTGKIHEDLAVTYKVIYAAGSIAFTTRELYFVRKRAGSITRKEKFYRERLTALQFYKEQTEFYKEKKEESLAKRSYREYAYALLENYNKVSNVLKEKEIALKIKKEYRRICFRVVSKDDIISLKTRILLVICFAVPELWQLLMKNE